MLLHQEEKRSDDCRLMVQWSKMKPKGTPVLQEGENETEDMLFQNLSPPLDSLAPLQVEQASLVVVPTTPYATKTLTASCFLCLGGSFRSF